MSENKEISSLALSLAEVKYDDCIGRLSVLKKKISKLTMNISQ